MLAAWGRVMRTGANVSYGPGGPAGLLYVALWGAVCIGALASRGTMPGDSGLHLAC
jgi:hypothetical protein